MKKIIIFLLFGLSYSIHFNSLDAVRCLCVGSNGKQWHTESPSCDADHCQFNCIFNYKGKPTSTLTITSYKCPA